LQTAGMRDQYNEVQTLQSRLTKKILTQK
jgi:hypothetical protein